MCKAQTLMAAEGLTIMVEGSITTTIITTIRNLWQQSCCCCCWLQVAIIFVYKQQQQIVVNLLSSREKQKLKSIYVQVCVACAHIGMCNMQVIGAAVNKLVNFHCQVYKHTHTHEEIYGCYHCSLLLLLLFVALILLLPNVVATVCSRFFS